MKKLLTAFTLICTLLLVSNAIYSSEKNSTYAYDPTGVWEIEVEAPNGTQEGTITISKDKDGDFEVVLEGAGSETAELEDISFDEEEKVMTGEVETDGLTIEIELTFDGDSMEGTVSAEGFEVELTGERESK